MTIDTSLPITGTVTDEQGNARPDSLVYALVLSTSDTNSDGEPDDIVGISRIVEKTPDSNGDFQFTKDDLPSSYAFGRTADKKYVVISAKAINDGSGEPLDNGRFPVLDAANEANATDYIVAYELETQAVDNFEDSIYGSNGVVGDFYDGDLANFSRSTNSPLEGTYSLAFDSPNQNEHIASTPGGNPNALPIYPKKGDVFTVLARTEDRLSFAFAAPDSGFSDTNLGYCVALQTGKDRILLNKRIGGFSVLADKNATLNAGGVYLIEVEWHDGTGSEPEDTIVVRVYEYDISANIRGSQVGSTIKVQDSDGATNEGIGYIAASSITGVNYYDDIRVVGSV